VTNPARVYESDDPNRFGTTAFYASIGKAFVTMCAVIPILFLIEVVDQATGHWLDMTGGIRPRDVAGLDGIVFAPLLHASFVHLYSNAVPLILTGTFVLASGGKRFMRVTGFVALASGLGVWFLATNITIGASGIILGYVGFLFMRGVVERSWWNFAVALLIGGLYGWQIYGLIETRDPNVSWQAHLFGLIGGIIAAMLFRSGRTPGRTRMVAAEPDTVS
jgi:membrane associated rhomboid family serine protease